MSRRTPKTIFVAGVHGVGKTTFSRQLSETLAFPCYSAGQLIRERRRQEEGRTKRVSDIRGNQDELATAFSSLDLSDPYVVIDGHFCILDAAAEITKVPVKTFVALNLFAAVILVDSIAAIHSRLIVRDGIAESQERIDQLQTSEVEHGYAVGAAINIPVCSFSSAEGAKAIEYVRSKIFSADRK